MSEDNIVEFSGQDGISDTLTELLRTPVVGKLITQAHAKSAHISMRQRNLL